MSQASRRTLALICLLLSLSAFLKLARKPLQQERPANSQPSENSFELQRQAILARYQTNPDERELVERVLQKFAQTAVSLEKTDGLRGLKLLDTLDLEAVYLYENHPREFRRLCELVEDKAAARILLTWRDYLGLKRADDGDRALWIAELERLSPSQRLIVEKSPELLPLMMSDPESLSVLVDHMQGDPSELKDCLLALQIISLKKGPASLRNAIETFERHPRWALQAFRTRGPEGLLVVSLFGEVLELLNQDAILDDSIVALHVAAEDVQEYLHTHSAESLADHLRHLSAAGLLSRVSDHPNALKLTLEFGRSGEAAVRTAGADSAEVIYADYADSELRRQAVSALADHGMQAAVVLEKYATDSQFREILRRHGSAIIPPIAQTDLSPELVAELKAKTDRSHLESLAMRVMSLSGESGQGTIRMIYEDGLERVSQIQSTSLSAVEFLPLYDLTHLANVMRKGYRPTSGEWSWALVDSAFVVADVMSLAALQPEGVVVAEATRSQVKTLGRSAVREGAENLTQVISKSGIDSGNQAAKRASQWWAVRKAGGLGRVMKEMPQAVSRMSISQAEEVLRPLARKAGMTISRFEPIRFMKDGREFIMKIPPDRGLKYLAMESGQAGVGLVAFWKMEEHLSSRRGDASQLETMP